MPSSRNATESSKGARLGLWQLGGEGGNYEDGGRTEGSCMRMSCTKRSIRDKIDKDRLTKRGMSNREKVTRRMRCLVAMRRRKRKGGKMDG
jgi:hypothetical protein